MGSKVAAVMRKESSPSTVADSSSASAVMRTTVVFPAALSANLEVFALQTGRSKNEVLTDALTKYLADNGLSPDKYPQVKVSYKP